MMANWDLEPMAAMLRHLTVPMLQIVGGRDGTIDPKAAQKTAALLRDNSTVFFADKGHLVHEEIPQEVAAAILHFSEASLRLPMSA